MFAADLTWADPGAEKVGERRERKARQRGATPAESIDTSNSSKSSVNADRDLWWTSGLKKAKAIRPRLSGIRPKTGRSSSSEDSDHRIASRPQSMICENTHSAWTYPTTHPLQPPREDPPEFDVPELEGDVSSRYTDSIEPPPSHNARLEVKTPNTVSSVDESCYGYRKSPASTIPCKIRRNSLTVERNAYVDSSHVNAVRQDKDKPQPERIEGALGVERLRLHESTKESNNVTKMKHSSFQGLGTNTRCSDRPLSQWDCLSPRHVPSGMSMRQDSAGNKDSLAQNGISELSGFQRFIRRMESASPKIVLDRLKEDWPTSGDIDEELALEKQLWLLTAFKMQGASNCGAAPKPQCATGRILELYGNFSEVYQLSALHPSQTVHFLTTEKKRSGTLPSNVSYLTVRESGAVPLPYPEEYFSHIRAPTLISLVPSAKLPEIFSECYKLLAPGGLLELRIIDAAPMRNVAGPLMRMWIEDRLSTNLERLFRCSKPCLLVPGWLEDAGFDLTSIGADRTVRLPCVLDPTSSDTEQELSNLVCQNLWKDVWGAFVDDIPDEPKWFWEDEDIVKECLQRRTVFECKTIFAYRR